MRRLGVAAVLAVVVALGGAGCSGKAKNNDGTGGGEKSTATPNSSVAPGPGGSSGPSGSPGASGGPIQGGNTKEICAAADKIVTEGLSNFLGDYADMMTAQGKGDTAGVDAAKKKAGDEAKSLAGKLREQGGKASEAEVKKVLDGMAGDVESLTADLAKLDQAKFDQIGEKLGKICG